MRWRQRRARVVPIDGPYTVVAQRMPVHAGGSTDLHIGEHPRQLSAHAQVCNLEQALQGRQCARAVDGCCLKPTSGKQADTSRGAQIGCMCLQVCSSWCPAGWHWVDAAQHSLACARLCAHASPLGHASRTCPFLSVIMMFWGLRSLETRKETIGSEMEGSLSFESMRLPCPYRGKLRHQACPLTAFQAMAGEPAGQRMAHLCST